MVIKDLSRSPKISHEQLQLEDVFRFDSRLYMKVSNDYDGNYNSYDFSRNRLTDISEDTMVEYVPSELVLHEKGWVDK